MTIDERLVNSNFPLPAIREINMAKHPTSISLGLGELKNFPVDNKITNVFRNIDTEKALSYAPNAGVPELRYAIAIEHQKYDGFNYTEDNVIVTIGVQNAMYATIKTLAGLGAKRVLIPDIHFGIYKKIPEYFNLDVHTYRLTPDFGIDYNHLESILLNDDIVILNSPANPTGRVLSNNEQEELSLLLNKKLTNGYVISDEIYNKLIYDGETPAPFSKYFNRTITLNGVSKSGAVAGMRVGWCICRNTALAKAIVSANASIISCPPTINQLAALPVVCGETTKTISDYNNILNTNRNIACNILAKANIEFNLPKGSFYLFPKVKNIINGDIKTFCINTASMANGVVVIPGSAFSAPDYIRISLASSEIEEGMNRLINAIKL